GDEQRRAFCVRIDGKRAVPRPPESSGTSPTLDLVSREAKPEMAHLLAILLTLVRHHVDHQYPSIRLERAVCLGQSRLGHSYVGENECDDREVKRLVLERKLLELAGANIHVRNGLEPLRCGLEHLWGCIHRDDSPHERGYRRGQPARSAAEVAYH